MHSNKPLSVWIAGRYLLAEGSALSYVSKLALAGLVLSILVLLLVVSVVNGFDRELRERVLAVLPQITVTTRAGMSSQQVESLQANRDNGLVAIEPYVQGQGLISSAGNVAGVTITGIDPRG